MGESLSTWTPSCNGAVRVELSGQRTTSDSGALLLREALDNSGVIEALDVHLSSTDRGASTVQDVMARNEVSLLEPLRLSGLAWPALPVGAADSARLESEPDA